MSTRSMFIRKTLLVITTSVVAIMFLFTFDDEPDPRTSTAPTTTERPLPAFFTDKEITKQGIFPLPDSRFKSDGEKPGKPEKSIIPERFFDPSVSNLHDFEYVINPYTKCVDYNEVFLLVAIATASWEFKRREIIRTTWGRWQPGNGRVIKYLFFVGTDRRPTISDVLLDEHKLYKDIVHENFAETYQNLTLKTIGQLKWATHFCPNAKYVMHIDDDVFAQIPDIYGYLSNQEETAMTQGLERPVDQLYCSKVFMPVVRRDGKWTMSEHDYPGKQYPLGCVGWCFIMPINVAVDLYFISLQTYHIHLEDVTVTGIYREKIGLDKVTKMPGDEKYCEHLGWPKDRPVEEKLKDAYKSYHVSHEH